MIMRIGKLLIGAIAVASLAWACGSDDGSGPPGTSGGSGGDGGSGGTDDDAGDDEIPPEPGTCGKICCSADDCGSGETCTAFDSTRGTLGVCSGAGFPGDGGGDPDAGTGLPPGCWSGNITCNPFTNEGCAAGDACDFSPGDSETDPIVDCFGGDNTQGPGETCDNTQGPWCIPSYSCIPN